MDLSKKDVADLLQVGEATIDSWVETGDLPHYELQGKIYFSKIEIENWIEHNHNLPELVEAKGFSHFNLFRAVYKGGVIIDDQSRSKDQLIEYVMDQKAADLDLDAGVFTDLLLDREALMPTAIGNGVAIPHARDFLLPKSHDVVITVFPKEPIDYGALDGQKVHTLFFLLACEDKRHLHLLAKLAHLSSDLHAVEFLKTKPDAKKLTAFIKEFETGVQAQEAKV